MTATATAQVRALFAQVPDNRPAFALPLTDRSRTGRELPAVPVEGLELSREETAAALFETCTDLDPTARRTTDALYAALRTAVRTLGPAGLVEVTDIFAGLDAVEFPEVGDCRWFAYRLCLSFWYHGARSRPMTAGEAAAALYLSDYQRTAGAYGTDPRQAARYVRQGAGRVPTAVLTRLGRTLVGDLARVSDPTATTGRWLTGRLLPDRTRAGRFLALVRTNPRIPLPVIVRPDSGGLLIGGTPPAGPGNRWARPLREEW